MTRSTRFTCFCTAQTSIFQNNFVKNFRKNLQKFVIFELFPLIFAQILMKFCRNFADNLENVEILKFSEIFEFSREISYFERIRMVRMVRMVRSLADRTFQPRSPQSVCRSVWFAAATTTVERPADSEHSKNEAKPRIVVFAGYSGATSHESRSPLKTCEFD